MAQEVFGQSVHVERCELLPFRDNRLCVMTLQLGIVRQGEWRARCELVNGTTTKVSIEHLSAQCGAEVREVLSQILWIFSAHLPRRSLGEAVDKRRNHDEQRKTKFAMLLKDKNGLTHQADLVRKLGDICD